MYAYIETTSRAVLKLLTAVRARSESTKRYYFLFLCIQKPSHTCRVTLGQGAILTDQDTTATKEPISRLRAA